MVVKTLRASFLRAKARSLADNFLALAASPAKLMSSPKSMKNLFQDESNVSVVDYMGRVDQFVLWANAALRGSLAVFVAVLLRWSCCVNQRVAANGLRSSVARAVS